jgi:antitoxin (DNA-binding transcriptional repressor) of toxin-antitoxin stability system
MGEIEGGTTVFLTKHGERIAKITPLRPTTWADHVHEVLGDVEPYDSGLTEFLDDDDRVSAALEATDPAPTPRNP